MKKFGLFACIFLLGFLFTTVKAQDSDVQRLGLPGDNLNLYAVLKLFQESETLEGFEKNLNDENNHINNLDLDGDGNIDYIKVEDNIDDNVHTIVLKIAVTPHENQDVAVFTVIRDRNNQVQIQLIGDDELYGKNYILEPNYDGDDVYGSSVTPNPGYSGNVYQNGGQTVVVHRTTYVEVAAWPVVRFIYAPAYVVYYSPWYYGYYPSYWRPWRPYYWDYYYGYHHNYNDYYYGYYRPVTHYRYTHWNDHYYNSRRSHSELVYNRREEGRYKETYSRPDTRKDGAELYRKTQQNNGGRPGNNASTRPDNNTRPVRNDAIRSNTQRDVNKAVNNRNDVNRQSTRTGTNQSAPRKDMNKSGNSRPAMSKPGTRTGENTPATRSDVNRKDSHPSMSRPGTRTGENKPATRQNVNKQDSKRDVYRPASSSGRNKQDSKRSSEAKGSRSDKAASKDENNRGRK
jgi:hypothetical protein